MTVLYSLLGHFVKLNCAHLHPINQIYIYISKHAVRWNGEWYWKENSENGWGKEVGELCACVRACGSVCIYVCVKKSGLVPMPTIKYCNRIQPTNNKSIILQSAFMESQIQHNFFFLFAISYHRRHHTVPYWIERIRYTLVHTQLFALVNFHLTLQKFWSSPQKNMIYFVKIKCCFAFSLRSRKKYIQQIYQQKKRNNR